MSVADTPFATTSDPSPAELRVGSILRVPVVSADPAGGDDGEIVYDSVLDKFRSRVNGAWTDMGGGGGGGSGNYFSPVDSYLTSSGDYIGNYTCGCKYLTTAETTILGLRFRRWTYAATILGEIWINGSAEAAKSVAVDPGLGPTEFTLTFDTPLVVPAWTMFYATTYDGGTRYAQTGRLPWDTTFATGLTVPVGSTILLMHPGGYKGGTGQPITFSDSNSYPVEPIT